MNDTASLLAFQLAGEVQNNEKIAPAQAGKVD
jgi:hypothetical protein